MVEVPEEIRVAQQEDGLRQLAEMASGGYYFRDDATPDVIFRAIGRYDQSLVLCTEALARSRSEVSECEVRYPDQEGTKLYGTDAYCAWREAGRDTGKGPYVELRVMLPIIGGQTLKLATGYRKTAQSALPEAAHHAIHLSLTQPKIESGVEQRYVQQLRAADVYYSPQHPIKPYYIKGNMYTPEKPGAEALTYADDYTFEPGDERSSYYDTMVEQHSVSAARAYRSHGFVGLAAHGLWDLSLQLCLAAKLLA